MSRVLVVVDSVLGLPRAFETSLEPSEQIRHFMTKAAEHKGYGARSSEAFFSLVLQSLSPQKAGASEARFPRREVETSLGANSVFQARPYQRNIQTGTYRIWKDLATPTQENGLRTLDLVSLWPFDSSVRPKKGLPIVAEGYPSLAWKILNRSHRGRPLRLDSSLTKGISGLARFSSLPADHQDAAFLALLAWDLLSKDQFHKPAEIHLEGDILGSVKT